VTLTSVLEAQTDHLPPELLLPSVTTEDIKQERWLLPHFADPDGNLSLRVQALVIETGARTVVVDPCVGNGKTRAQFFWNDQQWPFMERFAAAGFDPDRVDLVVHTHLHGDHVGWATHQVDGRWVPTFPNARYVYVEPELDWLRNRDDEDADLIYADSVGPIVEAGLADVVAQDADLGDGLRFQPTAGHTPGHASLWVDSGADAVLVTGDVMHHPYQCAHPTVAFVSDDRPEEAIVTRQKVLEAAARPDVLVFGTHFPTLSGGRVRPAENGTAAGPAWLFDPEPPHA